VTTKQWADKMALLEIELVIKARRTSRLEARDWGWQRADQIIQEYVNSFLKTMEWKSHYMKQKTFNFMCWGRYMLLFIYRNYEIMKGGQDV